MEVGMPGPNSGASTTGDAWSREPKASSVSDSSESVKSNRNRGRKHNSNSTGQTESTGQQRPPVRTRLPGNARDDLSLVSLSNGSDIKNSSREMMVSPPQGAGMYPPRNRYNVRLPPLAKKQY